jgi:hypothetical protein
LSSYVKVTTGALVVVPGPGQTITFVQQERGPYAGSWLLPGGKVEFGESLEDAAGARRWRKLVASWAACPGYASTRCVASGSRVHIIL